MSKIRFTPSKVKVEEPKVDLTKLPLKELKELAEDIDIDIEGLKKAEIIEAIEENEDK